MQNIFIDVLPPWVETGLQPAFYDLESGTVLQQTARMYAKVRELTEAYNTFTENVTDEINTFEHNVNETVDEYIEKFTELKTFVDEYFDNLDVQEEINNKLDAMVEDGTLAEIIASYLNAKAIFAFDSVSDMLSSTNLIEGSYAKTLGFYAKDDGGSALYKIRKVTNDDVIDGAFIIEFPDSADELVAELIIENGKIYVNQLGADSTGTNDASAKINIGLTKINSLWLDGSKINTLVFNGKYKIDEQIEVPACAKLRSNGFVKFTSSVNNDSTIFIHYFGTSLPTSDTAKQSYECGDIINFESGCLIEHTGDFHDSTATAIEIGDRTDKGVDYAISRYNIKNIVIKNFNVGMQFNAYNVYIGNHNNIDFEENMIDVQFGLNSQISTASNAGERMTFNECIFGPSSIAINYASQYWGTFFNNCSFDYNGVVFNCGSSSIRDTLIYVTGCHFEAFNNILKDFVNNTRPYVFITHSEILNSLGSTVLLNNCSDNYSLNLTECNLQHKFSETDYDPEHYVFVGQNINRSGGIYYPTINKSYSLVNNLVKNFADGKSDGSVSINSNEQFGNLKITERWNCGNTGTIVTDNYLYSGHKSLRLTKTSAAGGNGVLFNAVTEKTPVNGAKIMIATILTKGNIKNSCRCQLFFYDANNNQISATSTNTAYTNPSSSVWQLNPYGCTAIVPPNAVTYTAQLTFLGSDADDVGAIYDLGGVIVNAI